MTLTIDLALGCAWGAVGLVWLGTFLFTKQTVRAQSSGTRIFHIALAALGFALLSRNTLREGWLGMRFVPMLPSIAAAGVVLTVAGCSFAIWARLTLGRNWSGRATVKVGHELVTSGPYAIARHPIYTGLLLACAGTAVAYGEWHSALGLVVIFIALTLKMSQEERLMVQTFPATYPEYRKRVKALIPGIF